MNYYILINNDNGKYFDTVEAKHLTNKFSYRNIFLKIVKKEKKENDVYILRVTE